MTCTSKYEQFTSGLMNTPNTYLALLKMYNNNIQKALDSNLTSIIFLMLSFLIVQKQKKKINRRKLTFS